MKLTQKQLEYLRLRASGMHTKQIAKMLGLATKSIDACFNRINRNNGFKTSYQAIAAYVREYEVGSNP